MEELVVQLKKRDIYDCVNLIIVSDHGNRLFWFCWLYVKIGSCTCTCIHLRGLEVANFMCTHVWCLLCMLCGIKSMCIICALNVPGMTASDSSNIFFIQSVS